MSTGPAIRVDLPEGWRHRSDVAPFALFAQAHPWPERFAPNLTVAITPSIPGESPEAYLARQLTNASTSLTDALLIDAWADRSELVAGFVVAHATTGVDLTVAQQHRFSGTHVLAASATATDQDWPLVAGDLLQLIRSVRAAS